MPAALRIPAELSEIYYPQEVSKNKELADKIEKYTIKSNKN